MIAAPKLQHEVPAHVPGDANGPFSIDGSELTDGEVRRAPIGKDHPVELDVDPRLLKALNAAGAAQQLGSGSS
jgi:hypothetical protein